MIPTHVSNVDTCDCFIVEHCCHLLSIQPFPPREENTWKRVETRFRPTIIEAIDSRYRCKKKNDLEKRIELVGGENESTARGREYRRGQFDDPSGDLRARHPFILARRKSPF